MLRRVIGQRRVVLFFQAVKSADLSSVLHHEVLARVHGADGELKPAGAFLAVAKGAGLAMALDRLIVEEVLEHLRRVPDADVSLAVNLAPASVHNRQFVTWLSGALESEPGLARRLSFEVTASGASRDPENVLELARRLHRLGARFGLDHFGVGDLSFDYVCSLKMDYTKIDGAFIRGVEDNLAHRGFVEGCVEVGRGTDVQVIAEMVENEAELATLHRLGLDGVQGYLVGRPAPWGEG